ncbi:MAG: xcpT 2 [Chthoniobacteraceae bacterium]|nr:xcpT 2 [Chthoniobacteraceae bacterium]
MILPACSSNAPRLRAGLTLLEVITVLAIIAVLAGLLYPSLITRRQSDQKARAQNDIARIMTAVKQFYTEYGYYPPLADPLIALSPAAPDQFVGDLTQGKTKVENSMLMNTLRSIDAFPNEKYVSNPKHIVFFDTDAVRNPKAPNGGVLERVTSSVAKPGMPVSNGCFLDPWGRQYFVMIDTNHDDLLDIGQLYGDFTGFERPHTSVGVFSMGADNVIGTEKSPGVYRSKDKVSDDVISWQ